MLGLRDCDVAGQIIVLALSHPKRQQTEFHIAAYPDEDTNERGFLNITLRR